ncbi:MAG: LytTR family DNA-binding domain-containing protein [Gammaproteobacteria bacterium]
MRVLVVDDEAPARDRLAGLVSDLADHEAVGEAASGEEALELAQRLQPDLVLMDIRMPGMGGLEAARHLAALSRPPAVIFVTAYDTFAMEAFEAQAVGYLMKPVRRERLARALRHAARPTRPQLAALATADPDSRPVRSRIAARLGDALHLIPVDTVYYFQADQKYVTVRHAGGSDLIDEALKDLADEFRDTFVRVHRNALVALAHVEALTTDPQGRLQVRIRDVDELLGVSRRHAAEVRRRIQKT